MEFLSCRGKYTLLALSYYSSQKCCLGGAKLSEHTRPGAARQSGFCSKKYILVDHETKNEDYGDAARGKEKEAQ